jgi:two-component sensor histidine kinase
MPLCANELLLNEIKHRIRNTLATVHAIAGQTLRNTPSVELQAFLARLISTSTIRCLVWIRSA